jgi:hypothetical protein
LLFRIGGCVRAIVKYWGVIGKAAQETASSVIILSLDSLFAVQFCSALPPNLLPHRTFCGALTSEDCNHFVKL